MALHICRDLPTETDVGRRTSIYLISVFLNAVMNFTVVGQTNFNLTGSGFKIASGTAGSINLGGGLEQYIQPDVYTVNSGDIGKILAVRSNAYPKLNSGLFRISNVNTSSNAWLVDYRSAQNPPAESAALSWSLFYSETAHTAFDESSTGDGSTTKYATTGSATNSRIVLQSPHSSAWQVRLCLESSRDYSTNATTPGVSIAPGFNANSSGDFAPGGEHLHAAQFFNTANSNYCGGTVGHNATAGLNNITYRFYMWGDDTSSGSFVVSSRLNQVETSNNSDAWAAFGFCEDEQISELTSNPIYRMFSMGVYSNANGGFSRMSLSTTHNTSIPIPPLSTPSNLGVVTYGLSRQPVLGSISSYTLLRISPYGTGADAHPKDRLVASDSEYVKSTELLPCDVVAGVYLKAENGYDRKFLLEPRRLGRFPLARMGRINFGNWTPTSEINNNWLHLKDGIYLPWSGSVEP